MKSPLCNKNCRHVLALPPQLPMVGRPIWRLRRDQRVPNALKDVAVVAILYVLSPVDLVADFAVPRLSQPDDATLLVLTAHPFICWSPSEVVAERMASISTDFFSKSRPWLSCSARECFPTKTLSSRHEGPRTYAPTHNRPADDRYDLQALV